MISTIHPDCVVFIFIRMAREGIPFVLVPALFAILFGLFQFWILLAVAIAITGFMIFFFRDPDRIAPQGDGLIVSAADGRVTRIDIDDEQKLVSVFLSPFDVHINRSPIEGKIKKLEYTPGRKIPATNDRASLVNERNSLTIDGNTFSVTCTQIAGILARRIVCWPKVGDSLERGQRFGLIKFSSRTDILMPGNAEIAIKVGDKVRGGETIIARVP